MRIAAVLALLLVWSGRARADHAAALIHADGLLADGAAADAEAAAGGLLGDPSLTPGERAQAHRIRGLALFRLERHPEAEAELRAYLRLDPDAHLDPALVPPEDVIFFERVRTRHAGELRIARPRPKRKRYAALSFLPPLGQFQNGDTARGWMIAGAGAALLAGNVATYAMLRSSCAPDLTCDRDPASARRLRAVNLGSGVLLIGLWGYGVVDGLLGHRRAERREEARRSWAIVPVLGGGREPVGATASFSF
jgi:hypothetical protein